MTVDEAYGEVVGITRREARNFAWGIAVLPRPKRLAVAALYAFARRVDDIADDGEAAVEERRRGLESCRAALEALPGADAHDPVLVALADATSRYPVPRSALFDLVAGGLMDSEQSRYATWADLREYCRCVAGAVGLACAAVYGPTDPEAAEPRAETLGLALQQINIMRDVAEDWSLGRVYLPQDELARFGVSEADLAAGRITPAWHALMAHQADRARDPPAGRARAAAAARPPERPLRARLRGHLPRRLLVQIAVAATTSSRGGRSSPPSPRCGRSRRCEGCRRGRRPRRTRRRARPRRRGTRR